MHRWRLLLLLVMAAPVHAETVTVFAAASLTEAFRTIAREFEAAHAGATVEFNFAASSTLARQIVEGAPADVFASADEENMKKVASETADAPATFARNRLTIIVPKGNPKQVTGLGDLARPGFTVALAAPAVPVGRYGLEALAKAKVPAPAGSNEADVKAVVMRVALGEVDAGIAYVTDVAPAGDKIEAIAIPDEQNVLATYPIATLKASKHLPQARAFAAAVLSPSGRRILASAGFLAP